MLEYILSLCFRTLIPDCAGILSVYMYVYFTLCIYVAVAFLYPVLGVTMQQAKNLETAYLTCRKS